MKKSLALAAVLVALATSVHAEVVIKPLDLMKFVKLNTTDSTEVAIPIFAVGAAVTASQDTTEWLDIGGLEFPKAISSSVNLLDFQINHQSIATADSIGYVIQWTSDAATAAGSASKHTGLSGNGATAALVTGNATVVAGLTSSTVGGRWVRLILWNCKVTNSNVTRKFSILPVMRLER